MSVHTHTRSDFWVTEVGVPKSSKKMGHDGRAWPGQHGAAADRSYFTYCELSLGSVRILLNVPRKLSTIFILFVSLLPCFVSRQSHVSQISLELIMDGG